MHLYASLIAMARSIFLFPNEGRLQIINIYSIYTYIGNIIFIYIHCIIPRNFCSILYIDQITYV